MEEKTQSIAPVSSTPAPAANAKPVDTHSYKGWLNSDVFWKRALGVYGYSFVGSLIIAIPVFAVLIFGVLVIGAIFVGTMLTGTGSDMHAPPQGGANMKINIDRVCEGSVAYTNFADATSAKKFIDECKAGEHPEVIEAYKNSLNLGEGVAI